ncbi:pre-60S factor rei1 [Lecanora helva]
MATIVASRPTAGRDIPTPTIHPSQAQSHPYTCNTCQVAFRNSDLQRSHMRTDWHRYNLKRRVVTLPPLSSEVFAEKVLNAQASSSAVAAKAAFERVCAACQKTYYSENAYQNHIGSQRHRLREAVSSKNNKTAIDDEAASVMSSTISLGEPININQVTQETIEPPSEPIDPEAEAEFSKVVNGIKETSITEKPPSVEKEPVSRRPSRPHHSSHEKRSEHPLSPQQGSMPESSSVAAGAHSPSSSVPLNRCLFCNYDSPTFKLSVMHMTKYHGMFIPEQDYLVNLEGLITWLFEKIFSKHECLYCHKLKGSSESIQTHMKDKGHCMIAFETEGDMIDVGQFYDFSSTYSDQENDIEDTDLEFDEFTGGVKLESQEVLKTVVSDANGNEEMVDDEENADGWETDSAVSSLGPDRDHSRTNPRPRREVSGFDSYTHSHNPALYSDYELQLPSGRVAGHRSLLRYYRQNLHNHPSAAERVEQRLLTEENQNNGDEEMPDANNRGRQAVTRANGGQGMLGVTDAKKREVQAVEKRDTKRAQRAEKQYQWGVNKRANNQKHFRDPLLQ